MRNKILGAVAAIVALLALVMVGGTASAANHMPSVQPNIVSGPAGDNYHAVNPIRILDTRPGNPIAADSQIKLQVTGANGVPANATAVVVNVTATGSTKGGYLTVFPDGTTRGLASTLNFAINQTVANQIVTTLGSNGAIDIYNLAGTTDAVLDLSGYFTPTAPAPAPTTFGIGQLQVNGTTWASFSAPELGAPGGDNASGIVRFSCKDAVNGCNVSLQAYSTGTGWTVYPRIVLEKEDNTNGAKLTCEYADGSDNNGATTALTNTAATIPLGIGSTADCGGNQTGTQPASVNFVNVPGATGQGIHYDAMVTLILAHSAG